uniref:Uncharacterized protein n=1 Tax=Anguilla anguilla TaxID=7936 RepID=A0A0E9WBJ4_ANGAN
MLRSVVMANTSKSSSRLYSFWNTLEPFFRSWQYLVNIPNCRTCRNICWVLVIPLKDISLSRSSLNQT